MRFLFVLIIIFILILSCRKHLAHFQFFRLKNKIKNNPAIGIKQGDNSYNYNAGGYAVSYRVKESPLGLRVEWLHFKRRLTFIEKKILDIKRSLNKFFLYQRWAVLLRPSLIIVLLAALTIFYLGVKDQPIQQIGHFKWIIAQITGINPESIEYAGRGWFNVSGQRRFLDKSGDPVTIRFNPLGWLFFSDSVNINRWNKKLNKYVTYSVDANDRGDVWLRKKDGKIQGKGLVKKNKEIHGKIQADMIIWDEPTGSLQVPGHQIGAEDGKAKFFDE